MVRGRCPIFVQTSLVDVSQVNEEWGMVTMVLKIPESNLLHLGHLIEGDKKEVDCVERRRERIEQEDCISFPPLPLPGYPVPPFCTFPFAMPRSPLLGWV